MSVKEKEGKLKCPLVQFIVRPRHTRQVLISSQKTTLGTLRERFITDETC